MPSSHRDMPLDFYRDAFEHAMHAVIAVDDDRRIVAANAAAAKLFKTPVEELVGRSGEDFARAEDGDLVERLWSILLSGGTVRHEVEILSEDGQRRMIRVAGKGNVEPGLHLVILGDVTRSKEHELSSRRYELLRERAQDVVLFIGRDGAILEANHAAEATYGYTRAELLALNIRDLRHETSEFERQFRKAATDGVVFETMHKRKDGTVFPVEVSSRPSKVEHDLLLSVIRDITERRALQAKLLEADRLSTFGLIAAGIAHEINNPLAYALTNHELIAKELPRLVALARARDGGESATVDVALGLERCSAMLSVAMEGLERVRSIVRDLNTFSRADPVSDLLVDVHDVLDSAVNVAQGELRNAQIVRSYGEISPIRGSASRLGQVFLNVIVNGAQSIPQEREGEGLVRITTSTTPDGWACIAISDNGVGMSTETKRSLFVPFHTTKPGKGTGLGLYITKSIVESFGGTIALESTEGVGTTVTVRLPPYEPTLDGRRAAGVTSPATS
jgi:PAS domain S-box-containing protein